MQALIDVILPVFLLLGFGYVSAWRKLISEDAIDGIMRFAQSFAVPTLLFTAVARLDLQATVSAPLLLTFYAGAFVGFAFAALGAWLIFRRPADDCIAMGFVGMFSNSLLLGLPITERAYGTEALAGNYAIISIHAPLIYAFGITLMELFRARGSGLAASRLAAKVLGAIARNPLVIGIALGVLVNLTHLNLPGPVWASVEMMNRAAIPVALFGLGGVMVRYRPEGDMKAIAWVTCASLIVHPTVVWTLGRLVSDLTDAQMRSAVLTAAMAPGINAYLFANLYGAAKRVAASAVLLGTATSILTIWVWLAILP